MQSTTQSKIATVAKPSDKAKSAFVRPGVPLNKA